MQTVDVPQDVPLRGIPAERHYGQRLFFCYVANDLWDETLSFDENTHVLFDWLTPTFAHRQSEAEVHAWCADLDLAIKRC
jgi:hypothetical protein